MTLGGITATIKKADGSSGVSFRDGGNVDHTIGNLLRDAVTSATGLRLTLSKLKAGRYALKTFHHDPTTQRGTIDITVNDADGSNRNVADELRHSTGSSNPAVAAANFTFRANGSSDVVITFARGDVAGDVWLNGFALTRNPYLPPARVDMGATGQQTESKTSSWTNVASKSFVALDGFSATIGRDDGTTTAPEWFDSGDVSGTLGNLVEDGVRSSFGLRLGLTGLKPGLYEIKTYHHDATVTQGTIDIFVDDADRTNAQVANEVKVSKGTASPTIKTATFRFRVDATHPLTVHFRKGAVTGKAVLNGFELNRVYQDLDVTYIERTPRYFRYSVAYEPETPDKPWGLPHLCADNVGKKRWPDVGESVTYTGHVRNTATWTTGTASYEWRVGGAVVKTGSLPALAAGAETTVTLQRAFPAATAKETIELRVDTGNALVETVETNNALAIGSHDLTVSIWAEQGQYDAFKNTPSTVTGPSFEDFIKANIAEMNAAFARSTYAPFGSQGITDRVRIDKLVVPGDVESLGFTGQECIPDANDADKFLIDGRWSFNDGDASNSVGRAWNYQWYVDYVDGFEGRVDWGLVHELAHQLGLIDEYNMNLENNPSDNNGFHVHDAAGEISKSLLPTHSGTFDILWANPGVMVGGDTRPHVSGQFFEDHSVGAMNSHAAKRRGYYGEFAFDTPDETHLVVTNAGGAPLAGARVRIYQKGTDQKFDDTPEFDGTADGAGHVKLPNRAVVGASTETGHTLKANPFGQIDIIARSSVMFVRATVGGAEHWGWLFLNDLNLAYWSGHKTATKCTLPLDPPKASPTDTTPTRPERVCGPM
jgi:hypothetical protein